MILHRPASDNAALMGALLMISAAMCFAVMAVFIRYVTADLHPFEASFFRNLFGLLPMVPWMVRHGASGLKTERQEQAEGGALPGGRPHVDVAAQLADEAVDDMQTEAGVIAALA